MDRGFLERHPWDDVFWIGFVILSFVLVALGFTGQIADRFTGAADYPAPLALQVHVFAFFGWLTVLTAQVLLRRRGRMDWHRLLGTGAMALVPVMAWSAGAAEIYGTRFYEVHGASKLQYIPTPFASIICFVGLAVAAFLARRSPPAHKRLIFLATSVILVATFTRWYGDALFAVVWHNPAGEWFGNYNGVAALMLLGIGYDLVTRGRVHRVYLLAVPAVLAVQWIACIIVWSDWWMPVARKLIL